MFAAVPDAGGGVRRHGISARARAFRSPRRTIRRPTTATRCISTAAFQIVPPTDREIEAMIAQGAARRRDSPGGGRDIRCGPDSALRRPRVARPAHARIGAGRVHRRCTASAASTHSTRSCAPGSTTCTWSRASSRPIRTFPTVPFPNPEEPGATDELLKLAADVEAEVAIALDPDADRCAVGVPTPDGWRMLTGDETGWLLGDYMLSQIEPGRSDRSTPWWRARWCRRGCWPRSPQHTAPATSRR